MLEISVQNYTRGSLQFFGLKNTTYLRATSSITLPLNGKTGTHKGFAFMKSHDTVAGRFSVKRVFLKIPQNPQENTCMGVSFLIKLQTSGLQLY